MSKTLSLVILVISMLSIFGWFIQEEFLTTFNNGASSIKPITSICFILASIQLMSISFNIDHRNKIFTYLSTLTSSWILWIVFNVLPITAFGSSFNVSYLFYGYLMPTTEMSETVRNSFPSVSTFISFTLVSLIGFIHLFNTRRAKKRLYVLSTILLIFGAVSLIGLFSGIKILYNPLPSLSSGTSLPTAICFILYGIAISNISKLIKQ